MKPQRARRRQEEEADIIGMDLAARACYEPGAAMTLFTKLGEYERRHGVHVPKFLSTHPLSEVRYPPPSPTAAPPRRRAASAADARRPGAGARQEAGAAPAGRSACRRAGGLPAARRERHRRAAAGRRARGRARARPRPQGAAGRLRPLCLVSVWRCLCYHW